MWPSLTSFMMLRWWQVEIGKKRKIKIKKENYLIWIYDIVIFSNVMLRRRWWWDYVLGSLFVLQIFSSFFHFPSKLPLFLWQRHKNKRNDQKKKEEEEEKKTVKGKKVKETKLQSEYKLTLGIHGQAIIPSHNIIWIKKSKRKKRKDEYFCFRWNRTRKKIRKVLWRQWKCSVHFFSLCLREREKTFSGEARRRRGRRQEM